MTLKTSLIAAFAALTLTSVVAEAYIVPGAPPRPAPYPDPSPAPAPAPREEQRVAYINRRVQNETLQLRQLAGVGAEYRGYELISVEVEVRNAGPRAEISLITDGRVEQTSYSPNGTIRLHPRGRAEIGLDIQTIQLRVSGLVTIQSVRLNLRNRVSAPVPPRNIEVPLYISRRLYGNDRLDVTPYIDMNRLRGYRIVEIEIEAVPVYNTTMIDVMINSFKQGQTLQMDRYRTRASIIPVNAILGQGADNIVLHTRGDVDLRQVTLRLSAR